MKTPPPPLEIINPSTPDQLIGALSEALAHLSNRVAWAGRELEAETFTDRLTIARVLRGVLAQHQGAIELAQGLASIPWGPEA